jgi:hypothetical protein
MKSKCCGKPMVAVYSNEGTGFYVCDGCKKPADMIIEEPARKPTNSAVEFLSELNHISPRDISDILEALLDRGCLNKKGIKLWEEFWEMFICEKP